MTSIGTLFTKPGKGPISENNLVWSPVAVFLMPRVTQHSKAKLFAWRKMRAAEEKIQKI